MENCGKCKKASVPQYRFYFNLVPTILILIGLLAQLTPFAQTTGYPIKTVLTPKRIAFPTITDVSADSGYPDYQSGVRYDEYPIVVPKRAALILDRILKEIESAKDSNQLINDWSPAPSIEIFKLKIFGNYFYNKTKFGVDIADEKARKYSVKAKCFRWPLQIFYNILDLAAINAWVSYRECTGTKITRKFLFASAEELAGENKENFHQSSDQSPSASGVRKSCQVGYCNKNKSNNCCILQKNCMRKMHKRNPKHI